MKALLAWLALFWLGACAYEAIELGPGDAVEVEVLVVGAVPAAAIERLQSTLGGKADPKRLAWVYPDDALAVPANVAPLTFAWKGDKPDKKPDAKDNDVFELRLRQGSRELAIYTLDTSVTLDAARWSSLLGASVDGPLTCQLRALATGKAGELLDGATRTLLVRGPMPAGALYFESASGVARAGISDSVATALTLAEPSGGAPCRAGLAVSADGAQLGTACGTSTGAVWTLPALDLVRTVPADPARSGASALDGTGARSAEARTTELVVLDALHGAAPQTAAAVRASTPDWSPDGHAIVFVLTEPGTSPTTMGMGMGMMPSGPATGRESTSIVRVEQLADGSWSAPAVVVAASTETGSVLRTPRYSPDGAWIAFTGADGPADEVADARLFVVRARGGAPVLVGAAAAGPMMMNMMMAEKRASGSLPSWLPGDRPERAWLVFSSTRDGSGAKPAPMQRQLWVSAVDLLPEEPGIAVSKAAFWLPAQSSMSDNRHASFARQP